MPCVVPTATASKSTSTLDVNSFASSTLTVAARWLEASELLMMWPISASTLMPSGRTRSMISCVPRTFSSSGLSA